ncbi:apoptosis-enhancing nuclease isoform X2 [Rhinatrema bivittatum]|uniref:apoptosis-enhancing nuclease isoform X2 n=1 Tax=Rhinatrema bivittatum TaxID=194408 RepID=UPI00112A7573|nr:apoptosis-enhancing nuclease isoform X2 [Rhinatrema bivittatum]
MSQVHVELGAGQQMRDSPGLEDALWWIRSMERMPSEVNVPFPMGAACPGTLFHASLSSPQYLRSPHTDSCPVFQNYGSAPKRRKKKSRKHQRFLQHGGVLQQRGLSTPRAEVGNHPARFGLAEASRSSALLDNSHQLYQVESQYCIRSASSSMEKHCAKLNMLKEVLACSLPAAQSLSSQDEDSGLSMASSSATSRPSSPSPWQKPGKCVAMDCEMVGTGPGGKISELARCSVVSYNGDVIYDKYIKPVMPIVDYRTRWSGITKQHMKDAVPFHIAQKEILKILKGKLVVGHALHHDFHVLKYSHPRAQTRDTSKMPLLNQKAGLPLKTTASLKTLAWKLLHKRIQGGKAGHSSVEDALTALELYKLVETEWEQDLVSSFQAGALSSLSADSCSDSDHYMEDQYWPEDLTEDCK